MSCIYIIRNNLNDKVYIGQTVQELEHRYNQHIYMAKNGKSMSKIYVAMRELGINNFFIEKIKDCDDTELNRYEQYYVELYDSLRNGYNTVYPISTNGKQPPHDKVSNQYISKWVA